MSDFLKNPVIFIGFPRSGTSIISEIIFQHHELAWVSHYQNLFPQTAYINLIRNVFQNSYWHISGQKKQLNSVPLFNKYIFRPSEAYGFWDKLTDRNFGKSFLHLEEENSQNVNKIRSFFERMVKYQNRTRLAFKITGPSRLMYLYSIFPDACFVHIKRCALPAIRSLLRVSFWNQKDGKEKLWWNDDVYNKDELAYIRNLEEDDAALLAALQYYKINEIHKKELESINAKVYTVHYEDFIEKPKRSIIDILDKVGLSKDKNIETYFKNNTIYNRNTKDLYYISPDLDDKVVSIAENGIR